MTTERPRFPVISEIATRDDCLFALRGAVARDPATPVVLVVPAMGTPARFYAPLMHALARAGLSVVSADLRGQGERREVIGRGSGFGYRELIDSDLAASLAAIERLLPSAPVVLLGHSLGGQLAVLHAATRRLGVDPIVSAIVLVASGSGWFGCAPRRQRPHRLLLTAATLAVAGLAGYWPGDRFGFGGRQPARLMREWAWEAISGRYRIAGSCTDYEAALRRLCVPVLAMDIAGDRLTPAASVDRLCAKLPRSQIRRAAFAHTRVGGGPLDHFRWVRYHQPLVAQVVGWIAELDLPLVDPSRPGSACSRVTP